MDIKDSRNIVALISIINEGLISIHNDLMISNSIVHSDPIRASKSYLRCKAGLARILKKLDERENELSWNAEKFQKFEQKTNGDTNEN
jgi:hypothetical protein